MNSHDPFYLLSSEASSLSLKGHSRWHAEAQERTRLRSDGEGMTLLPTRLSEKALMVFPS